MGQLEGVFFAIKLDLDAIQAADVLEEEVLVDRVFVGAPQHEFVRGLVNQENGVDAVQHGNIVTVAV